MKHLKQYFLGASAAILNYALLAQGAQADPASLTVNAGLDTHTQKGQSDKDGDYKKGEIAFRTGNGLVLGATSALDTAQAVGKNNLRDTATAFVTIGKETKNDGLYFDLGVLNNRNTFNALYDLVDDAHTSSGMGRSRKSPASSDAKLLAGVAARHDQALKIDSLKLIHASVSTFGIASTAKLAAGAGVFLSTSPDFKPNLPDQPITAAGGKGLYAGIIGQGIAYDVRTDRNGTNPAQFMAVAGYGVAIDQHSAVNFEVQKSLTPEVTNAREPAVGRVVVGLTHTF